MQLCGLIQKESVQKEKGFGDDMMIDIHSHILPGLDDGSRTMEEFECALLEAKRQGIREIICTPHYYPPAARVYIEGEKGRSLCTDKESILAVYKRALPVAEKHDMTLYTGMECFYHSSLPGLVEAGEILPLAGSRYLLVEFSQDVLFGEIRQAVIAILDSGYLPVIAHYERYSCLLESGRVEQLRDLGALMQMNFDTIQRVYGLFRKNGFHRDFKKGIVDFMGSDCHGTHFRPLRIVPSIKWMEKQLPDVQRILAENPRRIIRNEI